MAANSSNPERIATAISETRHPGRFHDENLPYLHGRVISYVMQNPKGLWIEDQSEGLIDRDFFDAFSQNSGQANICIGVFVIRRNPGGHEGPLERSTIALLGA